MELHTKPQIIEQNGKPAFAILDWNNYQDLLVRAGDKPNDENYTPHEVIASIFLKNYTTIKAWRLYLQMTQQQLADSLGISQARIAKIEKTIHTKVTKPLESIALAMNISAKQLLD
ncbi:DNA-binding protein [uncultured Candidatus Thioglobus sp.]|nr:DNA-binding protein [uncultured Candidatus Thioglobus sp.]SMM99795.1 DNA-binding protein [uncultured Candidatus Thioglobus sp.]